MTKYTRTTHEEFSKEKKKIQRSQQIKWFIMKQ